MFSKEELDAFKVASRGIKPATKAKTRGRGGFLTSLLSEGGGLGGAVAGGAAGSFLGPIGTLLGAGIGGAVGAFGGRLGENKIRDDEYRVNDALKEGAISGVLSASPLRLLKGAGAAGKALASGSKGLPAFEQAIVKPGLTSRLLKGVSDKAAGKSIGASPSQLTKFRLNTGEDLVPFAQRVGGVGKSADDLKGMLPQFQGVYDDAINATEGAIDLETILKAAKEGDIGKLVQSSASGSRKLGLQTADELGQALGRGKKTSFSAKEILNVKRDFDRATKNYKFDDAAKAVPQNVSDLLKSILREASPESRTAGQNVSKLRGLIDIAEKQSDKGRGALSVGLTDLLAGGAGAAGGGVPGSLAAVTAKRAVNSPKAQAAISGVTGGMANRGAARALKPGSVSNIARRQLPYQGAEAILGASSQSVEGEVMPEGFGAESILGGYNETPGLENGISGALDPSTLQPQSAYSRESVAMDIQNDLQRTGGKNMDKYIKLYEFLNPETNAKPGYGKPSAQQYSLASGGLEGVNQLSQMLSRDPGLLSKTATPGQSLPVIGGLINRLSGTGEYQASAQNTLDALARARTGAAMTPSEEKFYQRLLPRAGDNPATVQSKLQILQQSFEPFMGYGQGSDAGDILSQLQGAY